MVRSKVVEALNRIFSGKEYSNLVVNDILRNSALNEKNAALFTQIVYGVLKEKLLLDFYLKPYLKGKVVKAWVRHILDMSIYQMVFLDKVPDYAIISEAVDIAKKDDPGAAKLVNAVLRNFEVTTEEVPEYIKYSVDEWLFKQLKGQYPDTYKEILESFNEVPKTSARVNALKIKRERIHDRGVTPSAFTNSGVLLDRGNWADHPLYKKGMVTIQDEASQLVARTLNPKRSDRILDVCAAPGGKTTHIAELMKNAGEVVANDLHEHKLRLIEQNATRLGLTNIKYTNYDGTKLRKVFTRESFDKILLDAPCSGWGVVTRKPEIKYFTNEQDVNAIIETQKVLLEQSAPLVKVDGTLVYSTCTLNRGENEVQVKQFLSAHPNFELEKEIMIEPQVNHTDGFYIAKLKKVTR